MDKGSHVSLKFHVLHPKLKSVKVILFYFFLRNQSVRQTDAFIKT